MAKLFGIEKRDISRHNTNNIEMKESEEIVVVSKIATTILHNAIIILTVATFATVEIVGKIIV